MLSDRTGGMKALPKPRSAWLLLGDSASFYTDDQLRRVQRRSPSSRPDSWTCSPRIEIGDVLFLYFMAPRKSINFVCRAASRPYVDPDEWVLAEMDRDVSEYQWWVDLTPPVSVKPISFKTINTFMGGSLNLRGRSGKFIDPAAANRILSCATVRLTPSAELAKASLERVVGRGELPEPRKMSIGQWRAIPSATLRLEREVEQYIVEPLLRFCGIPRGAVTSTRQMRMPDGIPDYVIASPERTLAVVEVKQRIAAPRLLKQWTALPDYQQLCRYSGHLACKGMLVDCDQVILFSRPKLQFLRRYERRFLTSAQIKEIRGFLLAEGDTAKQHPTQATRSRSSIRSSSRVWSSM